MICAAAKAQRLYPLERCLFRRDRHIGPALFVAGCGVSFGRR